MKRTGDVQRRKLPKLQPRKRERQGRVYRTSDEGWAVVVEERRQLR